MINLLFLHQKHNEGENMQHYKIEIYTASKGMPLLLDGNFFHGKALFLAVEKAPNDTPYMAVATLNGEVKGQILAIVHRRGSLFPPYLYTHAHVHGEGCYVSEREQEELFPLLLKAITLRLRHRLCLNIEFSDLQKKMYGYRHFRRLGYIPIPWQEIHNSLHSKQPTDRLSERQRNLIARSKSRGVNFQIASTSEMIHEFHQLLRAFYRFKLRRFIPSEIFFRSLVETGEAQVFVTTYKGKVIGGCTCAYSNGNAYLWYAAAKRKSYATLRPYTMTIWNAIEYAYAQGYEHFCFMDAGLPWKRNHYREFILGFGGKPVAKFRWFRFYPKLVNRILHWFYKS